MVQERIHYILESVQKDRLKNQDFFSRTADRIKGKEAAAQAEDQVAQALVAAELHVEQGCRLRPAGEFPGGGPLPGVGLQLVQLKGQPCLL